MKALITTILTDENQHFINQWLIQVLKQKVPSEIYIYDVRKTKHDQVHKMIKTFSNFSVFTVYANDIQEAQIKMFKLASVRNYAGICFLSLELNLNNENLVFEMILRSMLEGPIVPLIFDDRGFFWLKAYPTEHNAYYHEITDLEINGELAVPSVSFAIPGEILKRIDTSDIDYTDDNSMNLYLILQKNGFMFNLCREINVFH